LIYLFLLPRPDTLTTVSHGSEVLFVYGAPPDTSASALNLSRIMIDYWVSFATSLDPNDGHGTPRKCLIDHNTPSSCNSRAVRSSMESIHS
jgi:hypothetical protein